MILTVDKTKSKASCLSDSFINMGIPALALTPKDALSRISTLYRAVVVTSPGLIADAVDFLLRLRGYVRSVPVFALCDEKDECAAYFDKVFPEDSYASSVLDGILDYCKRKSLPLPGAYMLAGIDASISLPAPRYFNDAFSLTKTEALLLRTLIRSYPTPMRPEDIIEHVYRPGRRPEPSNTRTHISLMNKKFRDLTGRNLIGAEFGTGYRILTPELMTL